jgi:hypothetical protein
MSRPTCRPLRWGPIWAGLFTALGIFFLLSLGAIALGIQTASGTQGQEDLGITAVVVTSAIELLSFFIGGFVSSWSAALADPGQSMLNGFLVWALWLVAGIVLAAVGLGSVVGAMAELLGEVAVSAPDAEPDQLVTVLRESAWDTLLALGLTAVAATLGGVVGANEDLRRTWRRVRVV